MRRRKNIKRPEYEEYDEKGQLDDLLLALSQSGDSEVVEIPDLLNSTELAIQELFDPRGLHSSYVESALLGYSIDKLGVQPEDIDIFSVQNELIENVFSIIIDKVQRGAIEDKDRKVLRFLLDNLAQRFKGVLFKAYQAKIANVENIKKSIWRKIRIYVFGDKKTENELDQLLYVIEMIDKNTEKLMDVLEACFQKNTEMFLSELMTGEE